MDEEKILAKLDEINRNIIASHSQHFNWIQQLSNRQMQIEKFLGISDASMPFEPFYHRGLDISPDYPEIFNKYGEPMEVFFISDRDMAHVPNDRKSRYIIWDRYNYGLKTHFYTNEEMFRIVGKPERKFATILEPPSIRPNSYKIVLENKDYIEKNFDAIFTYDTQILANISNAKFYLCGEVWYGRNLEGIMADGAAAGFSNEGTAKENVSVSADNYKRKTKNISMIASAKKLCPMHIFRQQLAFRLKAWGVDTFGKFDGGEYVPRELPFEFYRYAVAVENYVSPYYFTEKILDCFASETIPIYIGATEIGKFFNTDGIIQISVDDANHIDEILEKCTPEEYERRLPAVIENYWRVQKYINFTPFDRLYMEYLKPMK